MTPYGTQVYKSNELETSPPWKIIIMSYEAIIKNLKIAKEAIKNKDLFIKSRSISKSQMIILTLLSMLDQSQDKDIVGSLTSLYFYYTKELIFAHFTKSPIFENASSHVLLSEDTSLITLSILSTEFSALAIVSSLV